MKNNIYKSANCICSIESNGQSYELWLGDLQSAMN